MRIELTVLSLFLSFSSLQAQTLNETERNHILVEANEATHVSIDAPKLETLIVNKNVLKAGGGGCEKAVGNIILEFKADGQLVSFPMEKVEQGRSLSARINVDQDFWDSRINETITYYLKTLETLGKFAAQPPVISYGLTGKEINPLRQEIVNEVLRYIGSLTHLDPERKRYYLNKVSALEPKEPVTPTEGQIPSLDSLIHPVFILALKYYDINGNRINALGELFTTGDADVRKFAPCCSTGCAITEYYASDSAIIPPNCFQVSYELRTENPLSVKTIGWHSRDFPEELGKILSDIRSQIDDKFLKSYERVTTGAQKLIADPADAAVDAAELLKLIDTDLQPVAMQLVVRLNNATANTKYWIMRWLWLTGGNPRINPFDYQAQPLFPSPAGNGAAIEKAKYELFQMLLNKDAFDIKDVDGLSEKIKELAAIKAKIDAEAKAKPKEPQQYDFLLYRGLLKSSPKETDSTVYMRHHDAKNDYLVMGFDPIKEINESERLYILVENKPPGSNLGVDFTTTQIATENSPFTKEVLMTLSADEKIIPEQADSSVREFLEKAAILIKRVSALQALSQPANLSIFFERDMTPNYQTDILEHNYLFEAPVVANYSIKSIAADKTEKEEKQGSYRINKLYRWRFKVGVVYSLLKRKDYTELGQNQFDLSAPVSGIDGTFGIQTYCARHDIRDRSIKLRPYVYVGLSMRNITENFYLGVGAEPLSGIAIGALVHFGKRETLTGSNGIPDEIRSAWGGNVGFSVLIDAALFLKLFSFGSANRSLVGF